jgi:hypothetical protein
MLTVCNTQDVRIEGGREYHSSYGLARSLTDRNNTFSARIWVYRWDQPGMFITLPGWFGLLCLCNYLIVYPDDDFCPYPGFDVLCTVEANLRSLWEAAPISQANGKQFKTINVGSFVC